MFFRNLNSWLKGCFAWCVLNNFVFLYSMFSFHTDFLSSCHECQSHSKCPLSRPSLGSVIYDTRVQRPPRLMHSFWGLKLWAVLKSRTRLNNYSYDHPCIKTTERLWNHRCWRDASAVKNTLLRPLLSSQHPQLPTACNLVLEALMLLSDLRRLLHA